MDRWYKREEKIHSNKQLLADYLEDLKQLAQDIGYTGASTQEYLVNLETFIVTGNIVSFSDDAVPSINIDRLTNSKLPKIRITILPNTRRADILNPKFWKQRIQPLLPKLAKPSLYKGSTARIERSLNNKHQAVLYLQFDYHSQYKIQKLWPQITAWQAQQPGYMKNVKTKEWFVYGEKAFFCREQGNTYKQIAEILRKTENVSYAPEGVKTLIRDYKNLLITYDVTTPTPPTYS